MDSSHQPLCRYSLVGIQEPSVMSEGREPDRVTTEFYRFDQGFYQTKVEFESFRARGIGDHFLWSFEGLPACVLDGGREDVDAGRVAARPLIWVAL